MLFNSVEFIFIFFPVVFTIYFILKKYLINFVNVFIAFASLFFYGYWNLGFSLLLLFSITINFYAAKLIELKPKNALIFVYIVLFFNIGSLIFFKYTNFIIYNINMVAGFEAVSQLNILLPLGISFYTFTQSSYIWDVYKGEKVEKSYINYLIFVTFFPHLIAGPLIHHKELFIQLKELNSKYINQNSVYIGMVIFIIGLAKKILLADNFSKFSNYLFNNLNHVVNPNTFLSWIGSISYSLQLYFDFSGYSDMAVGLGLIFGIILPVNFNDPYKKLSIIAFWKSWHISLTKYINEYLYTPIAL
jgi:alginate O-acetyltransferase complex protein AlgI